MFSNRLQIRTHFILSYRHFVYIHALFIVTPKKVRLWEMVDFFSRPVTLASFRLSLCFVLFLLFLFNTNYHHTASAVSHNSYASCEHHHSLVIMVKTESTKICVNAGSGEWEICFCSFIINWLKSWERRKKKLLTVAGKHPQGSCSVQGWMLPLIFFMSAIMLEYSTLLKYHFNVFSFRGSALISWGVLTVDGNNDVTTPPCWAAD